MFQFVSSPFTVLWAGGHIKLWSRKTLTDLLTETGFTHIQFHAAGRLPYLWMTMVMSGDKPQRNAEKEARAESRKQKAQIRVSAFGPLLASISVD